MTICPTITAYDPHEYREQLQRVESFATRLHIDVMDGEFAPTKSLPLVQTYWPETVEADIHLMYKKPLEHIETLVSLGPNMVVIHSEAEGDLAGMIKHLQQFNIKVGVALLQGTTVQTAAALLEIADHALIFSGKLGYHGGLADLALLDKVADIKRIAPGIEIGWDGGITGENIAAFVAAGIEVLNIGGTLTGADDPAATFALLKSQAE